MFIVRRIWDVITYPFEVAWLLLFVFGGAFWFWVRGWGFLESVSQRAAVIVAENEAKMSVLRKRRRELVREAKAVCQEFQTLAEETRHQMEANLEKAVDEGNPADEYETRRQLDMLKDLERRRHILAARGDTAGETHERK